MKLHKRADQQSTAGSVTIYFIVVTAAFVLLTALLIDFARIAAFRKQAELAVKSGVRSTLSSFDPIIYARYGLFIRGGESASLLFRETLEGNAIQQGEGTLPLLDTRWEETDVTESRPLANHGVFRRQILEEMKYKAPINLTLEVAERFRGMSGAMKASGETVDLLEKMRKAYDRRESALDEALDIQRRFGENIHRLLAAQVPYPAMDVNANHSAGEVRNIVDVAIQYEDYVSKRQEDEAGREAQRLEEEKKRKKIGEANAEEPVKAEESAYSPKYSAAIAAYESGTISLVTVLNETLAKVRKETEKASEEANAAYLAAKKANDEMIAIVNQAQSKPLSFSEVNKTDSSEPAVDTEHIKSIEQLRQTVEELVLDHRFFEEYEVEIRLQYTRGLSLVSEAAAFSSLASTVPGSTGRGQSLRSEAARLQQSYSDYVQAYGSNGSVCSSREASLQAHRSSDKERKQLEREAKAAWTGATKFLGSLTGVSGSTEEKAAFEQVNGLYRNNKEWNKAEEEQVQTVQKNDPFEERDEAIANSNIILDSLEGSLLGTRDQLYFSEYMITRLSHYDPSFVKEMLQGGEAPLNIDQQETEYILYGLNNPSANIAAAYSEIFAFRLAIRTMEGLVESRSMGHPLLVLAAALVYGIVNALLDMNLLVEKGTIQLSKFVKVDTRYTDYLRLFSLSHGGSANQMARTIAVMEHASGLSFSGAYTYASGEGSASVRLWFFPGLLKVMGRYGNLGGTVKGSRYEATYTADSSYQ
jgi:hypothetical protein